MSNPFIKNITKAGALELDVSGVGDGFGKERAHAMVAGGITATLIANDTTSPGTGAYPSGVDLGVALKNFTVVVVESGSITTHVHVQIDGSLDGVNWYTLVSAVTGNGATPATGTSTTLHAKYIRPNITTQSVPASGTVGLTLLVAAS